MPNPDYCMTKEEYRAARRQFVGIIGFVLAVALALSGGPIWLGFFAITNIDKYPHSILPFLFLLAAMFGLYKIAAYVRRLIRELNEDFRVTRQMYLDSLSDDDFVNFFRRSKRINVSAIAAGAVIAMAALAWLILPLMHQNQAASAHDKAVTYNMSVHEPQTEAVPTGHKTESSQPRPYSPPPSTHTASSDSELDLGSYSGPEDFYDRHWDEFFDYEEAEDYYYQHGGK